jgi:hypothetical protein
MGDVSGNRTGLGFIVVTYCDRHRLRRISGGSDGATFFWDDLVVGDSISAKANRSERLQASHIFRIGMDGYSVHVVPDG